MKRVKFIADFATKRIDDVCEYDGMVCHQLVNIDQVAEYTTEPVTEVVPDREHIEVSSEVEYKPAQAVEEKTDDTDDGMDLDLENQEIDENLEQAEPETEEIASEETDDENDQLMIIDQPEAEQEAKDTDGTQPETVAAIGTDSQAVEEKTEEKAKKATEKKAKK